MTDKRINTCEFFNICEAACGGTLEDTEMCHCYELYKQLARKEQECEELKQRLHQCWTVENSFVEQLDQLEAELKQEKTLKEIYFTCYKAKHEDIEGKLFRYKQTLTEIKEIAKNMNKECFYNDFDCKDCDMKNGCTYQGKMKILQLISEVEL